VGIDHKFYLAVFFLVYSLLGPRLAAFITAAALTFDLYLTITTGHPVKTVPV